MVSFSSPGIPNNATIEMSLLSEEELEAQSQQDVSVCLQLPDGQRLMENFPSSTNLRTIMEKFQSQLGDPGEEEEPVMVYGALRKEMVGITELESNTLRTLGLIQGRGLFRFFYKKPEELRSQANVYDMKVQDKKVPPPDVRHVPMRVAPDNTAQHTPPPEEDSEPEKLLGEEKQDDVEMTEAETEVGGVTTSSDPQPAEAPQPVPAESERRQTETPDSTQPEPIIHIVAPHDGVVFSATEACVKYQDIDDDFFELSLDEVKVMYRDLKQEVKKLSEGESLMTREMRDSQAEAARQSKLSQYKTCVLRVEFPCRHVVQGIFPPDTTISEVQAWLAEHLLARPDTPQELFTAPPRTVLPPAASLLELGLFPAALVHYASLVTRAGPVQYLTDLALASLSNITGANSVPSQARRRAGGQTVSSHAQAESAVELDVR